MNKPTDERVQIVIDDLFEKGRKPMAATVEELLADRNAKALRITALEGVCEELCGALDPFATIPLEYPDHRLFLGEKRVAAFAIVDPLWVIKAARILTAARAALEGAAPPAASETSYKPIDQGCCEWGGCGKYPPECKFSWWRPIRSSCEGGEFHAGSHCPTPPVRPIELPPAVEKEAEDGVE